MAIQNIWKKNVYYVLSNISPFFPNYALVWFFFICMYICYMYVCVYIHIHTYVCVCMYMCMHVYMYVCVCMCACACARTYQIVLKSLSCVLPRLRSPWRGWLRWRARCGRVCDRTPPQWGWMFPRACPSSCRSCPTACPGRSTARRTWMSWWTPCRPRPSRLGPQRGRDPMVRPQTLLK